jgi:integrase
MVDLDGLTFTIDQQVRELPGGLQSTSPKSEGSKRTLPLTPWLADQLRAHAQAQEQERLRLGDKWYEHGLVFPAENGKPKEPRNLLREYKLILNAAGLEEETRFHDLRHTAATRAGDLGMEEYVIAAMLGHGKKTVTRRYAQALISQMRPVIEAAERLYHAGDEAKHGS